MAPFGRLRWRKLVKWIVSTFCVIFLLMLIMKNYGDFDAAPHLMQKHAMKNFHVPDQQEANDKAAPSLTEEKAKEAASIREIPANIEKAPAIKVEVPEEDSEENGEKPEKHNIPEEQPALAKEKTATDEEAAPNNEAASVKEDEALEKEDASEQKNKDTPIKDTEALAQIKATEQNKEGPVKGEEPAEKKEARAKEVAPAKEEVPAQNKVDPEKAEAPTKIAGTPAKAESPELKGEALDKKKEAPSKEKDPEQKADAPSKEEISEQKKERPEQKKADPLKEKQALAKEEATEQKEATAKEKEAPAKKEDTVQKKEVPAKEEAQTKKETSEQKKTPPEKAKDSKEKSPAKEGEQGKKKDAPEKKKKANKMPVPPDLDDLFFGDVYAQQENAFLTKDCPSSIRNKINYTDFKSIFLEKIPILQWAPHATPVEYERLRRYNGCFGWNNTSWDLLKKTMDMLNTSANGYIFSDWNRDNKSRSSCIRCAAVGNGGILNGSKMGREIDQHDYVFRVNGAVVKGHEDDVGTRTSFYFFSTNTMMNSLFAYRKYGFRTLPQTKDLSNIFIADQIRDYNFLNAVIRRSPVDEGEDLNELPSRYFGENYTKEQFKMVHPDFMRYLRNRFLRSNHVKSKIYRPSTGAAMLLSALHACDEVDAYGFITPDYKNYSDHYYDTVKKQVFFYSNHDYGLELKLWQKLHEQGLIKLYTRS